MKISKDSRRVARQLMQATLVDGAVDEAVARQVVAALKGKKPRGYAGVLSAYCRLVRLELERRRVVVESAVALGEPEQASLEADLAKKHGPGLAIEYRVSPALLGGLRVRVGSDVWDGSVKGRLDRLAERIG